MTDPKDAAEALASIRQSRAAVAERLTVGSVTYDLIYSVLAGGMVAAWMAPMPWPPVIIGVCAACLGLLARTWAQKRGVWVSGVTPARARWVAIGLGVLAVGAAFLALYLSKQGGQSTTILGLAVLTAVVAFGASRLWLKVFRRETGADA